MCPFISPTAVSAFAVYVGTSLYLLFNPRLLHRRRTDENKRRFRPYAHISHRGGAAESYENTVGGFRQVMDCQVRVVMMYSSWIHITMGDTMQKNSRSERWQYHRQKFNHSFVFLGFKLQALSADSPVLRGQMATMNI